MATWPITQDFSINDKYYITLECAEQSYDIPNNTSIVSWKLTMGTKPNSFTGYSNYKTTINVKINNVVVYSYSASRAFNASAANSYTEVLAQGTTDPIIHQTNGAKSVTCEASVTVASGPYSPGSAAISDSLTLTTIPRASTASYPSSFEIGAAGVITITAAVNTFRHELSFLIGSASETISVAAGVGSYSWTPASTTYAGQFPTQTSRTGTMQLRTYSGSTLIGSETYTITLNIPSSWKPSAPNISLSPVYTHSWLTGKGIYVQSYTKVRVQATSTASAGTTIKSWTVSGAASMTQNATSLDKTSGVIQSSGTKTFNVTVTDARGRTASASASKSFLAYAAPAVTTLTVVRGSYVGGVWTQSDTGSDIKVTWKANCSLSSNGNVMDWSISSPVSASGTGLVTNTNQQNFKTGVGTTTAYTITVTVQDKLDNVATKSVRLATIEIPFVIDVQKPALGVGGVPQTARTLELSQNWRLKAGGGIFQYSTNDILADALNVQYGMSVFEGSGASYTGSVPGDYNAYKYGSFIVFHRSSTITEVYAIPYLSTYGVALNTYYSGTWSGWTLYMRNTSLITDDCDSGSVTISAGGHATVNITVTKTDYTPVGVVGITWSGSSWPCIAGYKLTSATNLAIYVVNPTSSSMSVTKYTASILYRANY